MDNHSLSIVIAIYNLENEIEACLESIIGQTFFPINNIEILLVNDGSVDHTEEVIFCFLKKLDENIKEKFKYLYKENGGLSSARNFGANRCCGEFVQFLDGDDTLAPNYLCNFFSLKNKNQMDVIVFDFQNVVNNKVIERNSIKDCQGFISPEQYLLGIPCAWNKIIRTSIFKENLSFPKGLWFEDLATTPLYALYTNKIYYHKNKLINYIYRENSVMHQKVYNKKNNDIFKVVNILRDKFSSKYSQEVEYIIISQLLYYSAERFLQFNRINELDESVDFVKKNYKNWANNIYLKNSKSINLITRLVYKKYYRLSNLIFKSMHGFNNFRKGAD